MNEAFQLNSTGRVKKMRGNIKGIAIANTQGGATSAAKMQSRSGFSEHASLTSIFIPGEGWVKWSEIHEQVSEAFRLTQIRRAMGMRRTRA